jgi:hypothetical protein
MRTQAKFFSQFVKHPLPDEAIDLICQFRANSPAPPSKCFLSSFGGACATNRRAGRRSPIVAPCSAASEPGVGWNGPELTSKTLGWVADFARALRPCVDGAYVNVPNVSAADWEAQYYGANAERLRRVKAIYDPHNVFTFEQSIPVKSS